MEIDIMNKTKYNCGKTHRNLNMGFEKSKHEFSKFMIFLFFPLSVDNLKNILLLHIQKS